MREREMRQRVERFLQTRLRSMLMPATLGLGLAIGGCNSDAMDASDDGGQTAKKDTGSADKQSPPDTKFSDAGNQAPDTGTAGMKYLAQIPDAGRELPIAVPDYMAQIPADSGVALRYMAQQPRDAGPDLDRIVAIYMAQLPVPRS